MASGGVESVETNPALSAAAEAMKRNTDCVYFLASPLTCKKGSECEFRHSEAARFNTRDCWYWYNGNCLNPKCSFRHPPLDGLFEVPGTASASGQIPLDSVPSLTSTSAPGYAAAYNTNKQNVACYYFQSGHCVKGSRCPFMHGPQPTTNADLHQVPVTSASPSDKPSTKVARIPKVNVPELKVASTPFVKETEKLPNSEEPTFRAVSKPDSNFSPEDRPVYRLKDELTGFESNNVPLESVNTRDLDLSWTSNSLDELAQNGRESDEFLGESSPGFDVLVDDQVEESEYFQNEDDYVRSPANGIGFVNDFEYQHPEYEHARLDRDQYKEMREYERYGSVHHEQHLVSSRSVERPQLHERRTLHRERSYDKMDRSDLRHRLSKKRRTDSRKSAVAADHSHQGNDYINRDRSHIRRSHQDDQQFPKESSLSSRLRGRITIPASSSADRPVDSRGQMDKDWRRNRRRLSPVSRINQQVEHHGGVKRRLNEHSRSSVEQSGHHTVSRGDSDSLNFAGPKSLAQLRSCKSSSSNGKTSSKPSKDLDGAKSEDPLSFEAPKSLSVILKRKREIASGTGSDSSSRDRDVLESQSEYSSVAEKGEVASIQDPSKVASVDNDEEGLIPEEEAELPNDGCFSSKKDVYESEDGMLNRMDDHRLDKHGQKSSDFEDDGGEYKEDDFETAYLDNDDDEDDEDDFAKKVGVMLS